MENLAATSAAGVLLDLSGVLILLLAFACLASKLFNRYVVYYGAQSVVLSFAAGTAAVAFHSAELWILAVLTLAIKGIAIPLAELSGLSRGDAPFAQVGGGSCRVCL